MCSRLLLSVVHGGQKADHDRTSLQAGFDPCMDEFAPGCPTRLVLILSLRAEGVACRSRTIDDLVQAPSARTDKILSTYPVVWDIQQDQACIQCLRPIKNRIGPGNKVVGTLWVLSSLSHAARLGER